LFNDSSIIYGQGQLDLLTANMNISVTDGGGGVGFEVSAVSGSGKIGLQKQTSKRDIKVLLGGSVGLQVGGEVQLDIDKGTFVFDGAVIFGERIEINWGKRDEK
jgi:hypothetical protein